MTELSALAVQNVALLRALNVHKPHETVAALAAAAGIIPTNVARKLASLHDAGLVAFPTPDAPSQDAVLTEAGRAQLDAIGRAERGRADLLPKGFAFIPHGQIRRTDLNPRTTFIDEEIAELARDIAQRGLLENLVVRPVPGEADQFELAAGEKRWRAIGQLVDAHSPVSWGHGEAIVWPAERPILCQVRALTDAELVDLAIAENDQRSDPNHLDIGRGYVMLMELEGITAKDVAARRGRAPTFVQQHVKAFKEAADKDRAAYLAGEMTWEKLRDRVSNPPPPEIEDIELTPQDRLILAELAHAAGWETTADASDRIVVGREAGLDQRSPILSRYLIQLPHQGGDLHVRTSITWNGARWLRKNLPAIGLEEQRDEALSTLQAEDVHAEAFAAAHAANRRYLTEWLNGPFELSEDDKAALEEVATHDAEAVKQRAEARRDALEAQVRADGVFAALRATPPPAALSPEIAGLLRPVHPLPWRIQWDGAFAMLVDAEGDEICESSTTNRMIALAINAAAGLATPEDERAGDEADNEQDDEAEEETKDAVEPAEAQAPAGASDPHPEPSATADVSKDAEISPALKRLAGA